MDTELFALQIAGHVEMLRLRLREAVKAYEGSQFQKHEEKNIQEFNSTFLPGSELVQGTRTKRQSYKPHLLRKDECLLEVADAIETLAQWHQSPSNPFPLERMLWAEQCLVLFHVEQKIPHETAADAVRYNWRVVKIIERADAQNQAAIKRGEDTKWTDYRVRKVVAGVIERHPEEFKFREDLKNPVDSGSVKSAVRDAIRDRGVHLPEKPRNKGRGRDS